MQQASPNASIFVPSGTAEIKRSAALPLSGGLGLPAGQARCGRNTDPVLEIQYQDFAIRCSAHRQGAKAFLPALEIRAGDEDGELVYERLFRDVWETAEAAAEAALKRGQDVVDGFCQAKPVLN